jgi:probable rRNA maturation factor
MAAETGVEIMVNGTGPWPLPKNLLVRGVASVLRQEGVTEGDLSLTFVDDDGVRALNLRYFGRDHPTDVIAFSLAEPGDPVLGDVYVGYEQAHRQAAEASVPLEEELVRLAIHGALHVLGYRHPEGEERIESEMFRRQEEIVARVMSEEAEEASPG